MTKYEAWSIGMQIIGCVVAIAVVIVALFGERLRQWLSRPKLCLSLREPSFTQTNAEQKGWYYLLQVTNMRRSSPAQNVRVMLTHVYRKAPDDSWFEQRFSGPTQVKWQWPNSMPQFLTVGPDVNATFAAAIQGSGAFALTLYWYPNNLQPIVTPNEPTRFRFKAVSDIAESKDLLIEVAWNGTWVEGQTEMAEALIVKQCTA